MNRAVANVPIEEFFTTQAQIWEARYESRTYRQRRDQVLRLVRAECNRLSRKPEEIDVLDFGCGTGVLLRDLLELGVRAVGVDSSKAMIEKAHAQLGRQTKHASLEWLQNSSGDGEYQARNYDVVVCISVLEFVPDLELVLSRLCSLVRSKGVLLVSVPNRMSCLRKIERMIHRHRRTFRPLPMFKHLTDAESYLNYQQHQLTLWELSRLVEAYGLRREKHRFHVAPVLFGAVERSERIGMMLLATFRK
jgi:2-polyprenyl-6-hydroxyphenyl methylase/3-demethylubiquinone-9 3-methyltransferase